MKHSPIFPSGNIVEEVLRVLLSAPLLVFDPLIQSSNYKSRNVPHLRKKYKDSPQISLQYFVFLFGFVLSFFKVSFGSVEYPFSYLSLLTHVFPIATTPHRPKKEALNFAPTELGV